MPSSLGTNRVALLVESARIGVRPCNEEESRDLHTLDRLGLLARHDTGIYRLTEAGRRYLRVEFPLLAPPPAS